MKKTILSTLALFSFAILGGGSFDTIGYYLLTFAIIFIVMTIIALICDNNPQRQKKENERREQERLEKEAKEKAAKAAYENARNEFVQQNGEPDRTIILSPMNFMEEIHVYEAKKKVFILGKGYEFKDIIACSMSDSPTVIKGKTTATTKSNTGSTIGRAVVGGVIAGTAGAVIGGTTGKKETEIHQEKDTVVHNYTVIINVNSISEPIIRICTGTDGKLTNDIIGLMNVVIARK